MNRYLLLDYLKGSSIFLVVWGHTIQYATIQYDFFANPVFILIYTFHMPLFMAVSGYLFFLSQAKRSFRQLARTKAQQILIPLAFWAIAMVLAKNLSILLHQPEQWRTVFTSAQYAEAVLGDLWFLWALFACSVITAIGSKYLGNTAWIYVALILVVLLLPNSYYFYFLKFTLPFYIAGFLYHKHAAHLALASRATAYLSFLVWPLLVLVWRKEAYIYLSGPSFTLFQLHAVLIASYRYLIGALGIALFTTLIKYLLRSKLICKVAEWLGTYSLGIYVIDHTLIPLVTARLHLSHTSVILYSLMTLGIAVLIIIVTGWITKLISQVSPLNQYLLGGRSANAIPKDNKLPQAEVANP